MHSILTVPVLAMVSALQGTQQSAQAVLEKVAEKQAERWAKVENYAVEQQAEGTPMPVPLYYEKTVIDGKPTFRKVPLNEWLKETSGMSHLKAADYDRMADAYDMFGNVYAKEAKNDPMAPFVKSMMKDGATFLRAGAEAERSGAAYADEEKDAAGVQGLADFGRRAKLVGKESVNGRTAFLLRADDLSDIKLDQPKGDAEFTLTTASLWIDASEYVPLRMKFDGVIKAKGKESPFTLELEQQDYRQVGPLYEPERRVMRMSGMMGAVAADPKQKKELEKARKDAEKAQAEYEKMKADLDKLPPAARKMVEGQMEKAMKQMEMLTKDGTFETVVTTKIISVNEGPPVGWRPGG